MSPLGGLQSAAHRRCAKRAGQQPHRCQIRQDQSRRANLKGQAPYASLGSCSPLFFSPQEAGDHRNPPLNLRVLHLVGCLGLICCSSDTLFKNDIQKTSKKMRKSMILASQNRPKILPKRIRNRCPKKHAIFRRFLINFFFFSIFDFLKMCVFLQSAHFYLIRLISNSAHF